MPTGICPQETISHTAISHVYYLSFYFPAVRDTSAEGPGIHTLPLFISLAVTTISIGLLISGFGSYISFLAFGTL